MRKAVLSIRFSHIELNESQLFAKTCLDQDILIN